MNLYKQYAQNRVDLRNVKKEIENLLPDLEESMAGGDIDLSVFRDEYFEDNYGWKGWVVALKESESEYLKIEMDLAILLDKKKKIIFECGDIKRLIYCEGIKQINRGGTDICTCDCKRRKIIAPISVVCANCEKPKKDIIEQEGKK